MKVEIWSDIACPFCYIGKRKFEQALETFEHKGAVEKTFKSFQLDPAAKKNTGESMTELLAEKYNMTIEKAREMNQQVAAQANEVGLDFQLEDVVMTNTMDAHRLSHYAAEHGKMDGVMERLLKAYFTEGADVGDHEVLATIANDSGLDKQNVLVVLSGENYRNEVLRDQQEGAQIGVQGVPFFVLNRKYAVSGAQPPEAFLEVLNKVWEEENAQQPLHVVGEDTKTCSDGSCDG
ncbi:DsbA family oxidoreductase [Shouchella shacheensis]|uniref:DsbA family oxidoreductase n=1 Tax=Shouchella shacheensis TaxID=1649580 RepID=UPI0007405079|nr:DsbA family oxidoreductase [Shouchella shacheensis]